MKVEDKIDSSYVESVLKKYNFEKVRRSKNGFTCLCPFHENHKTSAFSISDAGLWMCWSCGVKGNLQKLITRLGGELDWKEELRIMGAQLNSARYSAGTRKKLGVMPRDFKQYSIDNRPPAYILNRLQWPTVRQFKLGSSNEGMNRDRCIIPIGFKDKTVGFHGRAIKDGVEPKYYNSPGFEIKDFVFNYDNCEKGKDIIVVEGAFNAMSMWEKGFPNTVATFGTKFTPKQVQLIFSLAPDSITICFDRDSHKDRPGQKAAIQLANITYQLITTYIMPLPLDKDPNDLTAETLLACYQKRVSYDKLRG